MRKFLFWLSLYFWIAWAYGYFWLNVDNPHIMLAISFIICLAGMNLDPEDNNDNNLHQG